jgi:hypothetical protein
MIAPSVMNLTAPAFAADPVWMLDDAADAIVADPGAPEPVAEALDARRLELAAILVTGRHNAFLNRTAADDSVALRGGTLVSALRAWKNDFR